MRREPIWLVFILLLTSFGIWVILPTNQGVDFDNDGTKDLNVQQVLGLDLQGGLRILLEAVPDSSAFTEQDLRETANNISRRVNGLGLTEATVQVQGTRRILVEIPGAVDREAAINTIQQTALLEFVDFNGLGGQNYSADQRILTTRQVQFNLSLAAPLTPQPEATADPSASAAAPAAPTVATGNPNPENRLLHPVTGQPFTTVITGADLSSATAIVSASGQGWEIQFNLTEQGAAIFSQFTGANVGQPLAIVLDGEVLSAPRIDSQLSNTGVITGTFTEQEAKQLALQLRSGSLRVPLRLESDEQIGATLGQVSVELSIRAGIIGILVILAFMLTYYRVPGVAAVLALCVFIILNFALYKLIPITLTLPSITGFLISIGTAVDGNILIFERMKEELRAGRSLSEAFEAGFSRAWNSIRDSNFSSILISAVLFLFGAAPGASLVSGFAITLVLGLLVNLFTAVFVTRTFLAYIMLGMHDTLDQNRKSLLGI
jgi:protein-export membrane protein SecD